MWGSRAEADYSEDVNVVLRAVRVVGNCLKFHSEGLRESALYPAGPSLTMIG